MKFFSSPLLDAINEANDSSDRAPTMTENETSKNGRSCKKLSPKLISLRLVFLICFDVHLGSEQGKIVPRLQTNIENVFDDFHGAKTFYDLTQK